MFDVDMVTGDFSTQAVALPEISDMEAFSTDWNAWHDNLPAYAGADPNFLNDVFHSNYQTEGVSNLLNPDTNSGDWFQFNQESIQTGMQDILNGASAGLRSGVQALVGEAPRAVAGFGKTAIQSATAKFLNTATGKQVEQAAYTAKIQSWLANPLILFGLAVGFVFLILGLTKAAR